MSYTPTFSISFKSISFIFWIFEFFQILTTHMSLFNL